MNNEPALSVSDMDIRFQMGAGKVLRAVRGVSFDLPRGQTLGIIGESGSGKSTIARGLMGLEPLHAGKVRFGAAAENGSRRKSDKQRMQIVFQDSSEAFDPRMTVRESIREPLIVQGGRRRSEINATVAGLLDSVGLTEQMGDRRPHELSGGQRQRANIARALALDPDVLICDEPVSALDVSIQAGVLNLLLDLQEERGLSYVFISHDIGVVTKVCHRVAVMYLGAFVETGLTADVVGKPAHPYTQALLSAEPLPLPSWARTSERIVLSGELPNPMNPPAGCRFSSRCPMVQEKCRTTAPPVIDLADGRSVECHFAAEMTDVPVRSET